MDFYEVLDQVIDFLRTRGRVAYRALKMQFELDDEGIEALKDELIYAQQLAIDENDRVLVWTGDVKRSPTTAFQSALASEPVSVQKDQPTIAESLPPEPPTPDAERRQLTVMFCDLADSTRLSGQLDPEDLRDVIRAYQATSAEVIERYDGYIAQHLGDGLMVYSGWPQAHEDDAQRAVHAGLGILEAMQGLNARLEQDKGIRLAVRIGIHTGLVVVGEIGQGASQEHLALGETPNIASRIQGVAERDTVAISDATYRLVQEYFVCDEMGLHTLRGVDDAPQVYRVVSESDAQTAIRRLTPLVGRESETAMLVQRWEQVKAGQGQIILLSGEAGIGKSRLLQVLRDYVADEPHIRLECRSSPYYQNTALSPITDMLRRLLNWRHDDTPEAKLNTLEQRLHAYHLDLNEAIPLLATLLSLTIPEDRYPPLGLSPQRQRQKTLETIVTMLLQQAEQQPVLFILEDLHWTDPSTLEFLDLLIDQTPTAAVCVLLTCRPTFQPTWSSRSYLTPVTLNRLSRSQIEHMAERVAGGRRLPTEVMQQIIEKTDGVPLFVEEMTKAVLESGTLKAVTGRYELAGSLSTLTIPATLQDSLMARLDRLVTAKGVAQYAAVIGRRFSYGLLHAVLQLDEATLQRELGRLAEAELVYQRGLPPQATYVFKHALIQDIAYESLLRSTRQGYHQRIAQVLEEQFPETAEAQPELLAHHYAEAGLLEQGIGLWHKAGEQAIQRSAHVEAIGHLKKGLSAVQACPETPERALQELTLQRMLGVSLLSTKGYSAPEVESAYSRAHELCQHVRNASQVFPVLYGLWGYYHLRMEWERARELAEELLSLSQTQKDAGYQLIGHRALGDVLLRTGEFIPALSQFEQGIALYDIDDHRAYAFTYGQDPLSGCQILASQTLWILGYPDQSLHLDEAAVAWTQELAHPFSLARALTMSGLSHWRRKEWQVALERAETAIALSEKQHFALWTAQATELKGRSLIMLGTREGATELLQGLTRRRETGARTRTQQLAALAEVFLTTADVEEGLRVVEEGLLALEETGERWFDAELHRLKGELLITRGPDHRVGAEKELQSALTIARQQQAKLFELRAATSLARLWQSQGKRQEAYEVLAPVYNWFTEGFDTATLQEAKTLLHELA